jgi:shikimate kinase
MMESNRIERAVLLGFMGSGKSTVGQALARRMEWDFIDFDVEIERREGRSVAEIIADRGEQYFRAMEEELTGAAGHRRRVVLAPGGGWITEPALLESIRPNTFAAWLSISARETVRRLRADAIHRPLMDHPDPIIPISEMIAEREPLFRLADLRVPSEGRTIEAIAFEIEQVLRGRGAADWSD